MVQIKTVLHWADGTNIPVEDTVRVHKAVKVQAYFVKVRQEKNLGGRSLDADCGVTVEVTGLPEPVGFMADYRHSEYWCRPFFGKDFSEIPDNTQALLWQETDGSYCVVLPVCSQEYKCVLEGVYNGFAAKLFSWYEGLHSCEGLAFLMAEGENPFALMEACTATGLRLLGKGYRPRAERTYPPILEYLGWCSWDSFQIRVNEAGVLEKCAELREKKIPVRWMILDDMWAEIKNFDHAVYNGFGEMIDVMYQSKLYDFEASAKRFPHGLKHCIGKLKAQGMEVGMWYPSTGYWAGVDPAGPLAKEYAPSLMETAEGRLVPCPAYEKAYPFYAAFDQFLKDCGASFLKIDNQAFFRKHVKGQAPVGRQAAEFHRAIEDGVDQFFQGQLINCMGMAAENIWNRPRSSVSRCSDDFLPENPAWFTKHILQCAYNSFAQGSIYYCDWDMWWTDDSQAVKNSVLRAVSGGPVYVSDQMGRSKPEILRPLAFSDGKLLRCDRPAMPAKKCLVQDPTTSSKPFLVQNLCGECGVLAAFHLDEGNQPVSGIISPRDVEGLAGEKFLVYEYFTGESWLLELDAALPVTLQNREAFALYCLVPVRAGFAALGLTGKMVSPKAILTQEGTTVTLREGGEFAFWSERPVKVVLANRRPVSFTQVDHLCRADCAGPQEVVVQIEFEVNRKKGEESE